MRDLANTITFIAGMVLLLFVGAVLYLFFWAYLVQALAHTAPTGWRYDAWCCDGDDETGDCAPIPPEAVSIVPGGYQVILHPGEHRLVTQPHRYFMPHSQARFSRDGLPHACLYPDEETLRCLYVVPMGS